MIILVEFIQSHSMLCSQIVLLLAVSNTELVCILDHATLSTRTSKGKPAWGSPLGLWPRKTCCLVNYPPKKVLRSLRLL